MQMPEGPTSLVRSVLGIVPGGVEHDPRKLGVEEWFLRTELKTCFGEGLRSEEWCLGASTLSLL